MVHLPAPWPYEEPIDGPEPVIVTVGLTATQQATVDGRPVQRDRLIGTVIAMQTNDMTPRIVFEPDADAPYGEALQLLGELRRAGLVDWQFCFGGLPAHRDFGRADRPEPMGQRMPGISCDPRLLYAPHPMPVIAEPRPEPPVDYYIW